MINVYKYIGKRDVKDSEKTIEVQIPGNTVLFKLGAFLEVTISHPRSIQEQYKSIGKEINTVAVKALIDTGASSSVISPLIVEKLELIQTGLQKVTSVQDEQDRPVYYGTIMFPWGSGIETPLISCPLRRYECLIGRDVLTHWYFTYNGVDGSIVICD